MFPNASPGTSQASAASGAVPTADGGGNIAWLVPGAPAGQAVVRVPYVKAATVAHVVSAACIGLVDLESWGAGGSSSADGASATGGGGGYATTRNVPVDVGDSLACVVGVGGAINPSNDNGLPGGLSSVSDDTPTVLVSAGGGAGAQPAAGAPAAGGAVIVGNFGIVGGPGWNGGGVGGLVYQPGGMGANGGSGGSGKTTGNLGQPAAVPGGGGGGASGSGGMAGANGRVIVWEYQLVTL